MAKKPTSNRSLSTNKHIWKDVEVIELYAYLDYCVKHHKTFYDSVVQHLRTATKVHITVKQIKGKLKREFKTWAAVGFSEKELFSAGSESINLTEDQRRDIRNALAHIERTKSRYRLRSVSSGTLSSSRTVSRQPRLSAPSTLQEGHCPGSEDLYDLATSLNQEYLVKPKTEEQGTSGFPEPSTPVSDRDSVSSSSLSIISSGCISSPEQYRSDLRGNFDENLGSTSELSPSSNPYLYVRRTYAHTATQTEVHESEKDNQISLLKRKLEDLSKEKKTTRKTSMKQKAFIFLLENRLDAERTKSKALESSIRAADTHKDLAATLRDLERQNSALSRELQELRGQVRDVDSIKSGQLAPSQYEIWETFDSIRVNIRDSCSSIDASATNIGDIGDSGEGDEPIERWSQRISQGNLRELISSAPQNGLSGLQIIRSIAAAGICNLVFESQFPHFNATESPLLDQYRRHVLTSEGYTTLFRLDLLAHKSLISEKFFEKRILPENAATIADRFCNCLKTLIPPQYMSSRSSSPLEDDDLAFRPKYAASEPFLEGFVCALRLKAQLILSPKKYTLVFPQSGEKFNSRTMARDGIYQDSKTPARSERARLPQYHETANEPIKLCIFPALYSAPNDSLDLDENNLVQYKTFTEYSGQDIRGFDLVVKAIVLV